MRACVRACVCACYLDGHGPIGRAAVQGADAAHVLMDADLWMGKGGRERERRSEKRERRSEKERGRKRGEVDSER